MAGSLGFSTPILASSIVLVAMGMISLFVSFVLYRKSRAVAKFPKSLSPTIFNKTFSVFDPFPEGRTVIHGHLELVILLIVYTTFLVFTFVVVKVFENGLLLSSVTLVICLGLLMVDEVLEVNKNANVFINAVSKGAKFGKGDMNVLFFLNEALPRLSVYYLSLGVALFVFSIAVPFLVDSILFAFSNFAALIFGFNNIFSFAPHIGLLVGMLLFCAVAVLILFVSGRIKNRIFGFASRETVDAAGEQFSRMKEFVGIMHHHPYFNVPEPEKTKKAEEKEMELPNEEQPET